MKNKAQSHILKQAQMCSHWELLLWDMRAGDHCIFPQQAAFVLLLATVLNIVPSFGKV